MRAHLRVVSGADAGKGVDLVRGEITVGRRAGSDLRFDPERELAVSGTHASFLSTPAGWLVRDEGSLNGTLVNGEPISEPTPLREGDRIQFGPEGPTVEFGTRSDPRQDSPGLPPHTPGRPAGTRRLWTAVGVLSVALVGMILLVLHTRREGRRYEEQALAMQGQIDSILQASASAAADLEGRIQGLHDALLESRESLQTVRERLEAAQESGDSREIRALRLQLQDAQTALVRQQLAANLDYDAIEEANGRAVAKVFVDFGEGVLTATGFAVRPDGTLLTSRHVVGGPEGDRHPIRLAVQFANSRQVWPARVLATSPSDDLAALKVDNILGDVPVISGFNTDPRFPPPGTGVAIMGFPLGGIDESGEEREGLARTILSAGVVQSLQPRVLEVNGYGVEGSSGSPVFGEDGKVVGVLFGGLVNGGDRTLYAVPAPRAEAFLSQVR